MEPRVLGELIGLARATEGNEHLLTPQTYELVAFCFVSSDTADVLLQRIDTEKRRLVPMCFECAAPCGRNNAYDVQRLALLPENIQNMKNFLLESCHKIAALQPEYEENAARLLYLALYAIGMEDWAEEELQPILDQIHTFPFPFSLQ